MIYKFIDMKNKHFWIFLSFVALAMNAFGLYLQHMKGLEPCVKCIDQRVALYLVSLFSLLRAAVSSCKKTRRIITILTLASVSYATYLAVEHHIMASNPNPFAMTCALDPNLPSWLPLHEWIPQLFAVKGMCGETELKFLNKGLVEWTMIGCSALSLYTLVGFSRITLLLKRK
ncbi:MAG: hypothetical protein CMN72_00145 [Sphingomonas sp.]|nr:hypothetical protein [Sphingomonas sp.]|tara:strand:- start:173 stop:691 length:519 start_codon:yes stop_codon:yes gene_type:complete